MAAADQESLPDPSAAASTAPAAVTSRIVTIVNAKGLHARAAARFVKLAGQFDANVTVVKKDTSVSGLSIMGLMMLAASPGCQIEVRAAGREAERAVEALAGLVAAGFDEN